MFPVFQPIAGEPKQQKIRSQKGFTLLEILLVVATITVLAGIVIVAINPARQLGQTRNAQRRVDINTILNAVYQYAIDNNGKIPTAITNTLTEICKTGGTACEGLINLSLLTEDEKYLVALPEDPNASASGGTGYQIKKSVNGRITVFAPGAELDAQISVTR